MLAAFIVIALIVSSILATVFLPLEKHRPKEFPL